MDCEEALKRITKDRYYMSEKELKESINKLITEWCNHCKGDCSSCTYGLVIRQLHWMYHALEYD